MKANRCVPFQSAVTLAAQTRQANMIAAYRRYRAQTFSSKIATFRVSHDFPNSKKEHRSCFFHYLESARLQRKTALIVRDKDVRLVAKMHARDAIGLAKSLREKGI